MDFKEAAYKVLLDEKRPLSVKEITKIALIKKIILSSGKTPNTTMGALIYTDIKQKREKSLFNKVKRGLFGLKEWDVENIRGGIKAYAIKDSSINLISKLRATQYESRNPEEFESALKEAFNYFGFESELIGTPGDTDILLTANIGDETYRITVDGKTAKKGKILENQINWDSLKDHRKKNAADYTVVVGPSFSEGKLFERAAEHKIALLLTEHIIKLMEEHSRYPITLLDFKDLFTQMGNLSERVDDLLEQNRRKYELLTKFKIILDEMMKLQDAHGFFNLDRLCGRLLEYEIDEDTLRNIIELLKIPFINSIKEIGENKYILVNSTENIANLFKQISKELMGIKIKEAPIEKEIPEKIKKEKKLGTKYFGWKIKGDSIVAKARKENPYEHYCPLSHSIKIFETIKTSFEEMDIINAELIHKKLLENDLDINRKYKGKAEEYKIRVMLGILELEGLLGWTGSKRPIGYKLNVPIKEIGEWVRGNIKKKV